MKTGPDSTRRRLLGRTMAALGALGISGRSAATMQQVEEAIVEFGGEAAPVEGPLSLTLPQIAENGNSVSMAFAVDSPMTEDDHVVSVIILASDNPNVEVATFHFTPRSGEARASTRIRLARTQDVIAVARMSDGSLLRTSRHVKVTIGGCGG